MKKLNSVIALTAVAALSAAASAQVQITEVSSWGSGNSSYAADWFELTNFGSSAVNISGWSMDDDSANPGVAPLTGVTSIAAGESVVFLNTSSASTVSTFQSFWGLPGSVQIGMYTGSGVGLSTGGDQVNIFDNTNMLVSNATFGSATTDFTVNFNLPGADTAGTLSAVGDTYGSFSSVGTPTEVGNPGSIPAPAALGLFGFAGLVAGRRRR